MISCSCIRQERLIRFYYERCVTLECKECGSYFKQRFPKQTICVKCYYALNPEKDYVRCNKENLFTITGQPKRTSQKKYFSGYTPFNEQMGVYDEELLIDETYIKKVTKSSIPSKTGNVRNENKIGSNNLTNTSSSKLRIEDRWDEKKIKVKMKEIRESGFNKEKYPLTKHLLVVKNY